MSERQAELAALRVAARAYVEWEAELSGQGIPVLTHLPSRPEMVVTPAPAASPAAAGPPERVAEPRPAALPQPSASSLPPAPLAAEPPPPPPRLDSARAFGTPMQPAPARDDPAARLAVGGADKRTRLAQLAQEARGCTRCGLAKGRTQTVFSRGDPDARLMLIGEGPGFEEDRTGQPFVGPAGQLLDRMVAAMGLARDAVYICNVVKCRPPGNRTPLPEEGRACAPFLHGQLEAVQPAVIVALGRCATENLGLAGAGGGWRGRWGRFRGVDVMPTYHPAFLLRSPEFKRPVWEDLQKVMERLKDPP